MYKTAVLKPTKPAAATIKTIKDITFLDDDKIKRKIENATEGLPSQCLNYLCNRVLPASREYVDDMRLHILSKGRE